MHLTYLDIGIQVLGKFCIGQWRNGLAEGFGKFVHADGGVDHRKLPIRPHCGKFFNNVQVTFMKGSGKETKRMVRV